MVYGLIHGRSLYFCECPRAAVCPPLELVSHRLKTLSFSLLALASVSFLVKDATTLELFFYFLQASTVLSDKVHGFTFCLYKNTIDFDAPCWVLFQKVANLLND